MKKEMRKYWKAGYQFVVGSYYGDSELEEWEEVEEEIEVVEEDEWLELKITIDDEKKTVYMFEQNYD